MSGTGTTREVRRVAIIAGGGSLPREVALSLIEAGAEVHVVAIEGAADADLDGIPHTWVGLGSLGAAIAAMRAAQARELVIIGNLTRPDLWRLKPDLGFLRHLPEIVRLVGSGGDDSVLRRLVALFEGEGFRVIGVEEAAPELVAGQGTLGTVSPAGPSPVDIARGMDVIAALGGFDVGQAVVVAGGKLIAIEGAEGTDRMLERAAAHGAAGGVLVKRAKPGQDRRIDLPAIGPATVANATAAGLAGIAVEAGGVIIADRARTFARAGETGMFLVGVRRGAAEQATTLPEMLLQPMRERELPPEAVKDAARGLDLVRRAAPFGAGTAAVVSRGHVLALGAEGETVEAVIRRAAELRQWGASGGRRRKGVVVVRDGAADRASVLAAATEAGLAAVVLVIETGRPSLPPVDALEAAQRAGVTVATASTAAEPLTVAEAGAGERDLRLVLIAGEHSGDALGAKLMAAVTERTGGRVRFSGVGGEEMEGHGFHSIFPLADVAVMGPLAILKRLPHIIRRVHQAVDAALAANPDAVVIIDSPEFTHPIAKRIRKQRPDLPIIDYVSPSVWAWRPGRARKMRAYVDHVLALLPFEPAAHQRLGGPACTYVGHPMIEKLDWMRSIDPGPLAERLRLDPERPVLLVLPGSRPSEVSRLMQPFGEAVARMALKGETPQVVIPAVRSVKPLIEKGLAAWTVPAHLVEGEEDKLRAFRLARAALAASGTVTLELALAGTPMVVAYRVDAVAARLRFLLKVHSVVLANLVLGENAFPEYLQEECTADRLAAALAPLLGESEARAAQLAALARIPEIMKSSIVSPSGAAADVVLRLARSDQRVK